MNEPKKLWFKNKRYGWGWTPASWEGWVAIAIYTFLLIHILRNILALSAIGRLHGVWFAISYGRILFLTAALLLLCYLKGEKPRWHWGDK